MRPTARIVLLLAILSCARRTAPGVTADFIDRGNGSIDVRVTNGLANDVILVSPRTPSLVFDEARCSVVLSTKVVEWIRPYAFTPQLVTVKSGESKTFALRPGRSLPPRCGRWSFALEYTYLPAEEAREVARQDSVRFRAYVLHNQQVAQAR